MAPHTPNSRTMPQDTEPGMNTAQSVLDTDEGSPQEPSETPPESESLSIRSSGSQSPSEIPVSPTRTATEELSGFSEDDYITSDEEILATVVSLDEQRHHFAYGSTFAEHTEYFSKSLSYALESVALDKSLVAQAQLSGHLNNKSQKLAEKHQELTDKISSLRSLYRNHVMNNRIGELEKDLGDLVRRMEHLRNGMSKSLLFGRKGTMGVAEKYPVEYNQAKEKVFERVSDSFDVRF